MRLNLLPIIFCITFMLSLSAQSTASNQVSTFKIFAPQLDSIKRIWIYLPRNYRIQKKSYPVIYMHDAQNLFDAKTSYAGEWKVDEYLDGLTTNESIVIGIAHGNEKRIDELTPFKNKKYGGGKGDSYVDFIKDNLKPHIDSLYRTKPDANNTTIFGASLGGLISFYAAIKYPEIFGKAGVFSPSFWINPEIYDFVASAKLNENSKFYFLVGTEEDKNMVPDLGKMVALLDAKGVKEQQLQKHIIEGAKHNEKFWSEYFGKAYQWLNNPL